MVEIITAFCATCERCFPFSSSICGWRSNNSTHEFTKKLFPHQKENLTKWLNSWNPTEDGINVLKNNKDVTRLFSLIAYQVSNEIYDKKLEIWPTVMDSIVRNKNLAFDKKEYFTSLFIQLNSFSLQYLGKLYNTSLDYNDVFNADGTAPALTDPSISVYLGQLQCATTGLTYIVNGAKAEFRLTELGIEFVDFISNESLEKSK